MAMSHSDDHQEELVLTSEDFACCGWKEVLTGSDRKEYSLYLAGVRRCCEAGY